MRRKLLSTAILVFSLAPVAIATAQSPGDPAAGQNKARLCNGCHAIPGYRNAYPAYRVPKLGGQHAEYISAALKAYQTGQRSHPTMHAIAATLGDQDIADLAAYFSGKTKP
ncbi:MAG: cytochrome c [Gammaproteobacteria bacterium]|nr:MAG: cytochrome c [Gammaproteobacteria bacterium]